MRQRTAAQPSPHAWRWLLVAVGCVLALAAARALLASPPPRRAQHRAPHALVRERTGQLPRPSLPRRPAPHPLQIERVRLIDVFRLPKIVAMAAGPLLPAIPLVPPQPSSVLLVLLPLLLPSAVLGRRLGRPRAPPLPR